MANAACLEAHTQPEKVFIVDAVEFGECETHTFITEPALCGLTLSGKTWQSGAQNKQDDIWMCHKTDHDHKHVAHHDVNDLATVLPDSASFVKELTNTIDLKLKGAAGWPCLMPSWTHRLQGCGMPMACCA